MKRRELSLLSLTAFLAQQDKSRYVSLLYLPLHWLLILGKLGYFAEMKFLSWPRVDRDITSDPSWSNYHIIPSEVPQRRTVVLSLHQHQCWQRSKILKGSPKSNGCNYFRIDVVFRWWTSQAMDPVRTNNTSIIMLHSETSSGGFLHRSGGDKGKYEWG